MRGLDTSGSLAKAVSIDGRGQGTGRELFLPQTRPGQHCSCSRRGGSARVAVACPEEVPLL